MAEKFYSIQVSGVLRVGSTVAKCPSCSRDKGVTVYGYLGRRPRMCCPKGHDWEPAGPLGAPDVLRGLAKGRDWSLERPGPIPPKSAFRR